MIPAILRPYLTGQTESRKLLAGKPTTTVRQPDNFFRDQKQEKVNDKMYFGELSELDAVRELGSNTKVARN